MRHEVINIRPKCNFHLVANSLKKQFYCIQKLKLKLTVSIALQTLFLSHHSVLSHWHGQASTAGMQVYVLDVHNNTQQFYSVAETDSIEFHPIWKLRTLQLAQSCSTRVTVLVLKIFPITLLWLWGWYLIW